MSLGGCHRFDTGAGDVVEHVLGGERPSARLAVGAQRRRLGVLRVELGHQMRPQQTGGPELGDLHEEVHPDRPEEAETRRERIDVETGCDTGPHVLHTVGQRVGQFEIRRRSGLLHVVAGDRDRVEARHLLAGEREDVGDDPHARSRRIDVGVADHELLEDVVLDGPGELIRSDALFLGRHHIEGEDRQHCAVHGHRHAHLVEWDAVEELPHVEDRVDRHTSHADVAGHPWIVGVIAAVGGEIEGDRQTLLASRKVAPVEGVGLLGGGEPGVLTDRPRLIDVHRRVRTTDEGRQPGEGPGEGEVGVGVGVE